MQLHFGNAAIGWVVTAYVLTFGGFLLFGGRAADLFGRRLMLLAGMVAFTACSFLVGTSPDPALLVVPAHGGAWETKVSLRVEDHPDPLPELRRLYDLHRAYDEATLGDELTGEGRHEQAARHYAQAADLAPGNHELLFWSGLGTALSGDLDGGVELVREAIGQVAAERTCTHCLPHTGVTLPFELP